MHVNQERGATTTRPYSSSKNSFKDIEVSFLGNKFAHREHKPQTIEQQRGWLRREGRCGAVGRQHHVEGPYHEPSLSHSSAWWLRWGERRRICRGGTSTSGRDWLAQVQR